MERRQFLLSSCKLCAAAALGAAFTELTGCGTPYQVMKTPILDNKVQVPLTAFTQTNTVFVRPQGWYYDIAVEKKADNSYSALLLQCTHQENQLNVSADGYSCNLHGSHFDKDGKVRKGPAEKPLEHYKTVVNNDQLFIDVPKTPY